VEARKGLQPPAPMVDESRMVIEFGR